MSSKTQELYNQDKPFKLREFFCGECSFFCLTYPWYESLECPRCYRVIFPNQDVIVNDIEFLE